MLHDEELPAAPHLESGKGGAESLGGYGRLARRMSGFVGNLVATAAVLLIALIVGWRLTAIYRGAPAQPSQPAKPAAAPSEHNSDYKNSDYKNTVAIDVGDQQLAMVRSTVAGPRTAATARLREMCRAAMKQIGQPISAAATNSDQADSSPSAALRELIKNQQPIERIDAQRAIYESPAPLTLVVGTWNAEPAAANRADKVGAVAAAVLVWGIAIPTGQDAWAAYIFQPRQPGAAGVGSAVSTSARSVPIPPHARRLISLHGISLHGVSAQGISADGQESTTVTAIRGPATAREWIEFFDRELPAAGYRKAGDWTESNGQWHGRFLQTTAATIPEQMDIQFGGTETNDLQGLITITPLPNSALEGQHP
ncbi:MAG: hypothetical protein K8T25_18845 [Planctomycetia bacterium]|nr:hypothetical protein [Planctomycetia bacterium]